ncbi:lipid A-myristate beta-hydroxylase (EC 1.14.11.-) [Mycetohabitans rhizoxinica HKI 454]|uniref:Lipid A-myristate beta-hydroxylase n=1 Tax=Mycetohabitans rhizoxinica (strain DSM 19002 / CIP 109453 / HKI 454) TaxID=882378 RepID=E5AML6_MYCRK|nr:MULTISPECIES: lipid A-myristate beta-hydroxylase [Mycetohabitans]MCF7696756.1 aspartyl/asparaginyl beta-hydroxylase domain-containing protein [Mycetohabitans sp. B2]MCG1048092.1 aspartyl/asparaginyl beta-hydroxylase domain-containing protein [Mycetohabitans sp. B6]CBW76248.1 lipid A-myristate beta-hydroxylase (EC 1.14.11.-) [Mycetohabitans rhizoxinica HKI 454]
MFNANPCAYWLHDSKFLLRGDTFLYEVWNDSDEGRIVLLLNFFAQSR